MASPQRRRGERSAKAKKQASSAACTCVYSVRLLQICILGISITVLVNLGLSTLWHHSATQEKESSSLSLFRSSSLNGTSNATSIVMAPPNDQQSALIVQRMVERDVQSAQKHFSACLLIKDDNALLNEWIAYHYHTLKLRYLVLAVDPQSVTSPRDIIRRWQRMTDFQVLEWSDQDYMPASFLAKGYVVPLDRIDGNATNSKWHVGFEDPDQVKLDKQRINNHRFRQLTFLSACYRHLREKKKSWVLHIDTDEYVAINPILRARGKNGQVPVPQDLRQPMVLFRFLSAIRYRPRLKTNANFPCISLPRLMYGALVDDETTVVGDGRGLLRGVYNQNKFETLHWKYHTSLVDRERNALPKVIVDVSAVNETDEMFKRKAFSIHRPSKKLCRFVDQMDFAKIQSFPLSVNHYLGSWERYMSRNDTRRSRFAYEAKAFVKDGRDDWVSTWIDGFLDSMDAKVARELLQDYV